MRMAWDRMGDLRACTKFVAVRTEKSRCNVANAMRVTKKGSSQSEPDFTTYCPNRSVDGSIES